MANDLSCNVTVVDAEQGTVSVLVQWYKKYTAKYNLGFFQIGGGIAGDFPICVVPLIHQDLEEDAKL